MRSRYARGAVEVRSRCGQGTLLVRSRYARGAVEVRSQCGRGTLSVRSTSGSVRFVNFSTGDTVQLQYTIRTVYHIAGIFWPVQVVFLSFCNEQERKLDARFFRQTGHGLSVIWKNN